MCVVHVDIACRLAARGYESEHPDAKAGEGVKRMLL